MPHAPAFVEAKHALRLQYPCLEFHFVYPKPFGTGGAHTHTHTRHSPTLSVTHKHTQKEQSDSRRHKYNDRIRQAYEIHSSSTNTPKRAGRSTQISIDVSTPRQQETGVPVPVPAVARSSPPWPQLQTLESRHKVVMMSCLLRQTESHVSTPGTELQTATARQAPPTPCDKLITCNSRGIAGQAEHTLSPSASAELMPMKNSTKATCAMSGGQRTPH